MFVYASSKHPICCHNKNMKIIGIICCSISLLSSFPYLYYVYVRVRKQYLYFLIGQIWNLVSQSAAIYLASVAESDALRIANNYLLVMGSLTMIIMSITFFVQMEILAIFSVLGIIVV